MPAVHNPLTRLGRCAMPMLLTSTILGLISGCSDSSSKKPTTATSTQATIATGETPSINGPSTATAPTTTAIPTTTIKIGAPDDDAAAAAMNTAPFVTITLPPQPVTQPPTTPVPRTVPDLNIDPSAAERVLQAMTVPGSLRAVDLGPVAVRANAAAVEVATTATLRRSVQSASSRVFQRSDNSFAPVSLVIFDDALRGDALVAELASVSGSTTTTFSGKPAVEHTTGSATVIEVVDGSRVISVVKGAQAEDLVAAVLAASPASTVPAN